MKKRKYKADVDHVQAKKPKVDSDQSALATPSGVDHPVLCRLYPQILTLRHYLLSRLPVSSKNRRRRISQLGLTDPQQDAISNPETREQVAHLLDSTLVGVCTNTFEANEDALQTKDIECFSQQLLQSAATSTLDPGYFQQSETVDYVIWRLFRRHQSSHKPPHLLCHGFQRAAARGQNGLMLSVTPAIPGIVSHYPNPNVDAVKGPLWSRVHTLLGQGGDRIMMCLLMDCGIFCAVKGQSGNYYQLSGMPVMELKSLPPNDPKQSVALVSRTVTGTNFEARKLSSIRFVRSRMLYARAALNAKGGVRFGLRHIHVLNRFTNRQDFQQTVHIMKYIFPRQFGLHNVFTSKVDWRDTAMPFKDYTLREKEIHQALWRHNAKQNPSELQLERLKTHLPKRLRNEIVDLVDKLRKFNQKCAYTELLRHYCPVKGLDVSPKPDWRRNPLQPAVDTLSAEHSVQHQVEHGAAARNQRTVEDTCFTDLACPAAHVSAFCRAVIAKVIPNGFWGDDNNKRMIMYWIDQFVIIRRFESLTMHQVTQDLHISNLSWLRPPGQPDNAKMARTDAEKRKEILHEFIYWVFDSFLIPLVRSNFHITESNVHRNRLFYFRHDVWRMLTEPSLSKMKLTMFEELPQDVAGKILSARSLGFSKIRLLPKRTGARFITNLRRRQHITKNGVNVLGRSINAVMTPVFNALNYEKSRQVDRFGSSLFSVGDMFPRLSAFKSSLRERGLADAQLYFVKVDVQSCFDTIPQQRLLSMVASLLTLDEYQIGRHAEISPLGHLQCLDGLPGDLEPVKRFIPHGRAAGDTTSFQRLVENRFAGNKSNTVFVDTSAQHYEARDNLLQLLKEHVERNMFKVGKKFYRQKTGIPQGSVLSSILCNFFYAELEREILHFLQDADSLLLRLLDDFMLITTKQEHAERFLKVMHQGNADYGVAVKAEKSLANFDVVLDSGCRIARPSVVCKFPYCGVLIDTGSLEISKNSDRANHKTIADSLTVDMAKVPGQTFHRKALNGFKIQLHAMFLDTSLNSVATVMANLFRSFQESAVRCYEYIRTLSKARKACSRLLIKTVDNLIALAFVMLQRRTRRRENQPAERVRGAISRRQVQWLCCQAFRDEFQRRQTLHGDLLAWLDRNLAAVGPKCRAEGRTMETARRGWLHDT